MNEDAKRSFYKVTINNKKNIARLAINFLRCPQLKKKELHVYNTVDKPQYKSGFIFPSNAFCASYSDNNIPDQDTLNKILEKNDYAIHCDGALDDEDKELVSMVKWINYDENLVLMVPPVHDKDQILDIISYIENT